MTTALTPQEVDRIFTDSLFFDNAEDRTGAVVVEGIMTNCGFHPGRLESHREEIRELLSQLPRQFHTEMAEQGGGWSFLNACMTEAGELWTGDHLTMEKLFLLGTALEMVVCLLPREMWPALPGGMPYYGLVGCMPKTEEPAGE